MKLKDLPVEDLAEFAETVASLSAEEVIKLLEEGKRILKGMYEGGVFPVSHLFPDVRTVFHGDLHGDIATVYSLWEKLGLEDVLNHYKLVFLGDYVDRGPKQIEALLLVLALKARRPEEVVVLRGNHEPPRGLEPLPYEFPHFLKLRYGDSWDIVYRAARELFDSMPLSLLIEDAVVAFHAGPPTVLIRRGCEGIKCLYDEGKGVVEEILWNEPANICSWDDPPEACWASNPRGWGYLWGAGITRELLERTGTKLLVRADTPVDGVKLFHYNRGVSVFTRLGVPFANKRAGLWAPDFTKRDWHLTPSSWAVLV